MTPPPAESLKAIRSTRPVEIDVAQPASAVPEIRCASGLPELVQRFFAAMLLIPAAAILSMVRLAWLVRGVPGPFSYRQDRVGHQGIPFSIVKVRTMNNEEGPVFADIDDPRVIPLGSFLRRTHLDELPQLWNVVCGEMMLVGPRPEQPGPYMLLAKHLPGYSARVMVKPGMISLSNLRDGYARSILEHRRRGVWDRWYLRRRTMKLDFFLLVQGVMKMFRRG